MKVILAAIALFNVGSVLAFTKPVVKRVIPDLGWYKFEYQSATEGFFQTFLQQIGVVTITTCGCPGDAVRVFDNGLPLAGNGCLPNGNPVAGSCLSPVLDLQACYTDGQFCNLDYIISPGPHNITVQIEEAFYRYNLVGVRVDTYCSDSTIRCCVTQSTRIGHNVCVAATIG